jgi:hypothetical protein
VNTNSTWKKERARMPEAATWCVSCSEQVFSSTNYCCATWYVSSSTLLLLLKFCEHTLYMEEGASKCLVQLTTAVNTHSTWKNERARMPEAATWFVFIIPSSLAPDPSPERAMSPPLPPPPPPPPLSWRDRFLGRREGRVWVMKGGESVSDEGGRGECEWWTDKSWLLLVWVMKWHGPGWRMHGGVEDTKLSTNKQHTLSYLEIRVWVMKWHVLTSSSSRDQTTDDTQVIENTFHGEHVL